MQDVYYCPFFKDECLKDRCMLYEKSEITHVGRGGNCAVLNISRELKNLAQVMDQSHKFK